MEFLLKRIPAFFFCLLFCFLSLLVSQAYGSIISPKRSYPANFTAQTENQLFFTFHSPDYPWTSEELGVLGSAVADFYPVIRTIYGEPAFSISVNIRKDPAITFAGEYSPFTKEIVLRDATQLDVLCHEMIHAFRDENMILISSYEEGMTRAVEVEVFNRLPAYSFWNEHHSYPYDVYYEGLNRQVIGSQFGNFDYTSPFLLLRYDLAGYAWAKVFLEKEDFFAEFNRRLYRRILHDPSTLSHASALQDLAHSLQPVVEGKPFPAWYEQQGIFDPAPRDGYFLYQNISNFNVYYFFRDASGSEEMIAGAPVEWEIYDHQDNLLLKGSCVTSRFGWIALNPLLPADYKGRIKIVSSASTPDGVVTNTAFTSAGDNNGIFGIVEGSDSGTITIIQLDNNTPIATADVVNGIFALPSLGAERGRFVAIYDKSGGEVFSRQFNKDASSYFLPMVKSDSTADLSLLQTASPDQVTIGNTLMYTLIVTNHGPDTASEVVLTAILPPGMTMESVNPAQGSCTVGSSSVACALDTINQGASVAVTITVTPNQAGIMESNAFVTANVSDPDLNNNSVMEKSTVVDMNPAIQTIVLLINRVTILADQETMNHGQGKSLVVLLEAAKRAIEGDKTRSAINQLDAFISHATALVRAGILPQVEGEELKNTADSIIINLTQQYQVLSP
jgi:uncharacterized repeat protein (TIGR01451 family)